MERALFARKVAAFAAFAAAGKLREDARENRVGSGRVKGQGREGREGGQGREDELKGCVRLL